MECDYCAYNAYDEEAEEYYCSYFKNGDEYQVVRHQM